MSGDALDFFYDYVDPASYLVDRILAGLGDDVEMGLVPRPFELRRPPGPMVDAGSEEWRSYLSQMKERAAELGIAFDPPELVPWSRKAHELALHARGRGIFPEVHDAIFRGYFVEGRDVGRVDVLVELATDAGLDRTEAKAVLDVDKYLDALESERERAERHGVRGVPTLLVGERRLEGFHAGDEILTFLRPQSNDR